GPTWSSDDESGMQRDFGTRPEVGCSPVTPQHAAGMRMLPPVSVPSPPRNSPAALPDAVPELEPPGQRSRSHGLRGTGRPASGSGAPKAYSESVALPTSTPPAVRRRATASASSFGGAAGLATRLCAVVT